MKIYIAGPMTGVEQWNFPAFFKAEEDLKSLGHEAVNPAHNNGPTLESALEEAGSPERPNHPWSYYMRRDLPHVMGVDALCVLPGWRESKGASLEVKVAEALGLPILVLKDGKLVPRVTALGLSGWARSGKDSVANHLVEKYGYTKMSFADPMKDALVRLNPIIDFGSFPGSRLATAVSVVGWEQLKGMSEEVRPLLQRFGTEVARNMWGEDFWVNAALASIPDGSTVVFADVRFPNEAEAVKKLGGQVWRVERLGYGPANDHVSEHALDDYKFDVTINNFDTLPNLYEMVDGLKNDGY
jgi:hypothetical protein